MYVPTVFRAGPYRLYFHSHEPNEPPHVHVDRDAKAAKFWLEPVTLARNIGFRTHELSRIRRVVMNNQQMLREAWREFFGQ